MGGVCSQLLLEQSSMEKQSSAPISLRKGIDVALSGICSFLTVTDHLFCLGSSEHRVALIRVIFCPPVTGLLFQGYFLNTHGFVALHIPKECFFQLKLCLCGCVEFAPCDRSSRAGLGSSEDRSSTAGAEPSLQGQDRSSSAGPEPSLHPGPEQHSRT